MKKLVVICFALLMMASLATLVCSAGETDTTIKYGTADVDLSYIDDMSGTSTIQGFPYDDKAWGIAKLGNGELFITADHGMFDHSTIQTGNLLSNGNLGSQANIVFKVTNTSDGDIKFSFQPKVDDSARYLSALLAARYPIMLVSLDGTAQEAEFYVELSAGREVFKIPYEFEGYIVIPNKALATTMCGTVSVFPDNNTVYEYYGFHVIPDDATYVELAIEAAYSCTDLPEYVAPVIETTTGEYVTNDPFGDITTTESVTTTFDIGTSGFGEWTTTFKDTSIEDETTNTDTDTDTDTDTTSKTIADVTTTDGETTSEEAEGCKAVAGGAMIVAMMTMGVAACTKKKH